MSTKRKSDTDSENKHAKKKQKTTNNASNNSQAQVSSKALTKSKKTSQNQSSKSKAPATKSNSQVNAVASDSDDLLPPISGGVFPFNTLPQPSQDFLPTLLAFQPTGTPRPQPVGLENPRRQNRCYQNSVLTALLHCKRFVAYIQGWHMPREYSPTFKDDTAHVLSGLNQLASSLYDNNVSNTQLEREADNFRDNVTFCENLPKELLVADWKTYGNATDTSQSDAAEFLGWLLQLTAAQLESAGMAMEVPFDHLVQIRRTQRNCCKQCAWPLRVRRTEVDCIRTMPLNPPGLDELDPSSKEYTLALLGTDIVSMEAIISHNLHYSRDVNYRCPRCDKSDPSNLVMVNLKLQTAPEMLILCIARFAQIKGRKGKMQSVKYSGQVAIEEEIDIGPWLEPHNFGEDTSIKYKLVGLVSHQGKTLSKGHYISYVRSSTNSDQWYELDDDAVTKVKFSAFSDASPWPKGQHGFSDRNTPYLLIYERDHETEVITSGREPMNRGEATPGDVKPEYWIDEYSKDHPNQQISARWRKAQEASAQSPTPTGKKTTDNSSKPVAASPLDSAHEQHVTKPNDDQTSKSADPSNKLLEKKTSASSKSKTNQQKEGKAEPAAEAQKKSGSQSGQQIQGGGGSTGKAQQNQEDQADNSKTSASKDIGIETSIGMQADTGTQTEKVAGTDIGTQTKIPAQAEAGTQTEMRTLVHTGTQTETASMEAQDGMITLSGPLEDQDADSAQLDVRITIGDFTIDLPSFLLSQFDKNKKREMRVDAWIKVPQDQGKNVASSDDNKLVLNITDVMLDAVAGKKGAAWKARWKSSHKITKSEPMKKQLEPTRRQPGRAAKREELKKK